MSNEPKIIVRFPVRGSKLPADHGYALFSAISQLKPEIHSLTDEDNKWFGLELISGVPFNEGVIALPSRGAALRLRIDANKFGSLIDLSGKKLSIDGHTIQLGIATAFPIQPAPMLYSRIVTFKNAESVEKFLETAHRDLTEKLGITAKLEIPKEAVGRHRRIITIRDKKVVGFSLIARDFSDEDSITLMSHGLGGRRAMGCGIFNPVRKPRDMEGDEDAV